ncbi:MAG: helix-turn-helix transcriptional regulator [Bacilli bacterium]|nr:helix-turn-helix transcriptional regulator [Bacilli bacterium]
MNQEKIGKFITKCRKEKKLTQEQLAEKLGVTSKSISRWENGKTMPDVSLFKPLCDELDIAINDLLSGEVVEKNMYQKKFEENMFSVISNVNTKISYVRKTIIILVSIISLIFLTIIIIGNHKVVLNYNANKMYVEERGKTLIFTTKDLCTIYSGNINQYSILDEDNNEIIFLTSKCSYNEIIKKSVDNGNSYRYYPISVNGKNSQKIKIYYTDSKISNIKNVSKKQLEKYIINSVLIYEK